MENKKMGRPTEAPRTNNYRIRMTDQELEMLEACCTVLGKTKADIIRTGIERIYSELKK
ncbi:MAG: hypothetical protein RSE61_05790 [Anaerovoracaceae bacterium]